ncbi:MAG TPA: hypothetical protein VGR55_20285 [Candidatus Acidoferrum sp.]|nr:hypothetical protein [Candidatus Acidoferrum sp.]
MLRINDEAPNFAAETSQGTINFHEWLGNGCSAARVGALRAGMVQRDL